MPQLSLAKLPEKQARLDDMLANYRDVQDTLFNGQLGDGTGVIGMPDVWSKSGYPILERLLRELRVEFEAEETWPPYWHIREWYFRAFTVRRPVMRRDKKGRVSQAILGGVPQVELVTLRYEGLPDEVVRSGPAQVLRGLFWLGERWPETARFQPESVGEIVKRLERKVA